MITKTIKSTVVKVSNVKGEVKEYTFVGAPKINRICKTIEDDYEKGAYMIIDKTIIEKKYGMPEDIFIKNAEEID